MSRTGGEGGVTAHHLSSRHERDSRANPTSIDNNQVANWLKPVILNHVNGTGRCCCERPERHVNGG